MNLTVAVYDLENGGIDNASVAGFSVAVAGIGRFLKVGAGLPRRQNVHQAVVGSTAARWPLRPEEPTRLIWSTAHFVQ
ncbi:hypothetical protein [Spongiactinospora sp. TRM90649]|uniref:hypothetical protein n=1 Tax=Spongiactinospora sp. TRM90649 TaxID=3031114 RepID=UPI0023F6A224|nr:hypothetical protein [Spongiactinospora sp. TRM90649]MDF5756574.1 hypothetical protein [Spongiactinospora sp. TRM90649]